MVDSPRGNPSIREREEIREDVGQFELLREEYFVQSEVLLDESVELKQELRTEIQLT